MKKKIMIISLILISLISVYFITVVIDCNRLKFSKIGTKPLITLNEKTADETMTYNGLGYSVIYRYKCDNKSDDFILCKGKSSSFMLFNKIKIWHKHINS